MWSVHNNIHQICYHLLKIKIVLSLVGTRSLALRATVAVAVEGGGALQVHRHSEVLTRADLLQPL